MGAHIQETGVEGRYFLSMAITPIPTHLGEEGEVIQAFLQVFLHPQAKKMAS